MAVMALAEVEEEADTCLLPPPCKLCSASCCGGQLRSSSSLSLRHSPMYSVFLLMLFSQNCWAGEMRRYNTLANIHFFSFKSFLRDRSSLYCSTLGVLCRTEAFVRGGELGNHPEILYIYSFWFLCVDVCT